MRTVFVRDFGALQERNPFSDSFSNVKVVKVTDKDDIALRETGVIRTFGQLPTVNGTLVKSDPSRQSVLAVGLYLHIEHGALFVL